MRYFTFFCTKCVKSMYTTFYTYSTSQFREATFQVLSSHMWPPHPTVQV